MLNIPVDKLRALGAECPLAARDAWCRCRALTWEIRQRVRLEPLAETLHRLPAAHAYVGGDATRLFFAMLAAAYAERGAPLTPFVPAATVLDASKTPEQHRAELRARAAEMEAELELLRAAVGAEVAAWTQLMPAAQVQCPFTGEVAMLLNDGRVAIRVD